MIINRLHKLVIVATLLIGCSDYVEVTAHRGASGLAPENTIASVKKAIELKADYSEIDAQEISDGSIIIFHDTSLNRTTGNNGNIWNQTLQTLSQMEAGSWFSEEFTGEKIPLLEEIIDLANDAMKLNIELKMNGNEKLLAKKVVKIVHNKNFVDRCIITSFDFNEVNKVREIDRNIKIGYIFKNIPEDIDVFTADCEILSVSRKIVDSEFVNKAKLFNKEIHVWTVNNPEEMEKLINLGVDNIITDRPDVLRSVLNKLSRNPFL